MRYVAAEVTGEGIEHWMREIRSTHVNGGVVIGRFQAVDADASDDWFGTRTKLEEYATFRELLDSDAVRTTLSDLLVAHPFPVGHPPEFDESWTGTLTLDGEFAATLVHGGAYKSFAASAREAKLIGLAAVADLVQDRHEDFRVFGSYEAWTPWFHDIAWDRTWILADRRGKEVTLICKTDTD